MDYPYREENSPYIDSDQDDPDSQDIHGEGFADDVIMIA